MNYTENYHFPQWEETDRVMRTDFNQMCADMEAGLVASRIRQEELEQQELERFCRTAYNHYTLVRKMETKSEQVGVFYRNPLDDRSGLTGMGLWNGVYFTAKNSNEVNYEVFAKSWNQLSALHVERDKLAEATPLTATFRVPAPAEVRRFCLRSNHRDILPDKPVPCRLTVTNQETGRVEFTTEFGLLGTQAGENYIHIIQAAFCIFNDVDYLLTIVPLEAACTLDAYITMEAVTQIFPRFAEGVASVKWTLPKSESGAGAMVVFRCTVAGTGGKMSLFWDGVEREPFMVRDVPGDERYLVKDFVFLRGDAVSSGSEISFRFECDDGGCILLYDWGGMLF